MWNVGWHGTAYTSHDFTEKLVREGATDAQEVKRALREYLKSELKENCPDQLNCSYFIFSNHRRYTPPRLPIKTRSEFSKFDQDNFNAKVKQWKADDQNSFHFSIHI